MPDRLAERFAALDQLHAPVSWNDVEALEHDVAPLVHSRPRRARRRLLAALAFVALLVGVITALVWIIDRDPSTRDDGTVVVAQPTVVPSTPTTLTAARTSRTFAVSAWTGEQYLAWAGEAGDGEVSAGADGFAFDARSGTTSDIPLAPIAPRSGAAGVWTGRELVVCCGSATGTDAAYDTTNAAVYRKSTHEWERVAAPPVGTNRPYGAAVWTGSEMIVVFGSPSFAVSYDPATNHWRRLAGPPAALSRRPQAVWTVDESRVAAARLSLRDSTWRAVGDPALPPLRWYEGAPGSQAVAWDPSTRRIVVWPVRGDEYPPGSKAPLLEYDPASGTWTRVGDVDLGYRPAVVAADGVVYQPDRENPVVADLTR